MTIYILIGVALSSLVMTFHLKTQPCSRNAFHHTMEAMLMALVWPVLIIVMLAFLYNHFRNH